MSDTIEFVEQCIAKARAKRSKITPDILALDGMSDEYIRHFLNNVMERPDTYYLEIGIWKGSCTVSALYKNRQFVKNATLIDNYSIRYEDTVAAKNTFISNMEKFLVSESGYKFTFSNARLENISEFCFYDLDSFSLEATLITNGEKSVFEKRNVYIYDGRHTEEGQFRALTFYDHALADEFIYIVDDWKLETARVGTRKAFSTLNYRIKREWELPFYNGYFVAVIEKTDKIFDPICPQCNGNKFVRSSKNHNIKSCLECNWSYIYR